MFVHGGNATREIQAEAGAAMTVSRDSGLFQISRRQLRRVAGAIIHDWEYGVAIAHFAGHCDLGIRNLAILHT